jgi:hypothetical protein
MAQRDRVGPHEDFLHQQSQNLLSRGDIQDIGPHSQFIAKTS